MSGLTGDCDAVGVARLVEHKRHLAEVVAILERDQVDLSAALAQGAARREVGSR